MGSRERCARRSTAALRARPRTLKLPVRCPLPAWRRRTRRGQRLPPLALQNMATDVLRRGPAARPWLGAVSRDRDREPTARRHRDDDTLMTRSRNINISSMYISAADAIDVTARIDDILALVAGPAAGSGHPGVSAHVSRLSNACTIAIVVRDGDAWTVASRLRLESYSRNQHWHHVESWIMTGAGSWRHARSPIRPEDRRGRGTGPGVARSRSTRQAASPVCHGEHGRRGRGLAAQRVAGGRDGEAGERRGATAQHACRCTHPNGRGGRGLHALECAGGRDGGRRVSAEAASGAS